MPEQNQNFISIPDNSFTIFIGSRLFLTESLADIPRRFSHRNVLYIHFGPGLPFLHPTDREREWIEFRQVENPVDILAMVESDPARFLIIEYYPEWFRDYPEYIQPFGFVCRERSQKRKEVLLISLTYDNTISELESMADKLAFVQDILESPNKKPCDVSQVTLENSHPSDEITKVPARAYGQQPLGW